MAGLITALVVSVAGVLNANHIVGLLGGHSSKAITEAKACFDLEALYFPGHVRSDANGCLPLPHRAIEKPNHDEFGKLIAEVPEGTRAKLILQSSALLEVAGYAEARVDEANKTSLMLIDVRVDGISCAVDEENVSNEYSDYALYASVSCIQAPLHRTRLEP